MLITNNNGVSLELHIIGYQFPIYKNPIDANWLIVEGRVSHPNGNWSFRDPCLETYDTEELADWLEAVAYGLEESSGICFTERHLVFEVESRGSKRVLRVQFAMEARPPWLTSENSIFLEFPVITQDILLTTSAWRKEACQFPTREP